MEKNFKNGVCLLFIVVFVITLLLFYNIKLFKRDNKQLKEKFATFENEIEELNKKMTVLENKIDTKEVLNTDTKEYNETFEDEDNESKRIDKTDYLKNVKVTDINQETKKFACIEPKVSFEFPKEWKITSNDNWSIWNVQIEESPDCTIQITKIENNANTSLKDLLSLDYGSTIIEEGATKISNCEAYFKKYTFGDANYYIESKSTVIDAGNNNYYEISIVIPYNWDVDESSDDVSRRFIKFEKYYNQVLSSLEF